MSNSKRLKLGSSQKYMSIILLYVDNVESTYELIMTLRILWTLTGKTIICFTFYPFMFIFLPFLNAFNVFHLFIFK